MKDETPKCCNGVSGDLGRRDLLDSLLIVGGAVWCAGVAVPAGMFLWPVRESGPGAEYARAGPVKDFPVGGARMVQHQGKPILVLRVSEDEFRAFSAVCTHLGCVVRWDDASRRIHCPCHAGFFAADGSVISGPPERPLPAYRAVVAGDELRIYG